MKKIRIAISAIIIGYLVVAFIKLDLNPQEWNEDARTLMFFISALAGGMTIFFKALGGRE